MARAFMSDIKNLIPDQQRQDQDLVDHNNDPGAHPGLGAEVLTYGALIAGTGDVWTDVNATDFTGHPYAIGTALEIKTNAIVTFGHNLISYLWQGPRGVTVGVGGTRVSVSDDYSPLGTADHSLLNNREIADAHPTAAVTGLDAKQASQDSAISANTGLINTHTARTDNPHSTTHTILTDRGDADAHPMSAITGLVADQQRQDDALATAIDIHALPAAAYDFNNIWWSQAQLEVYFFAQVQGSLLSNTPWAPVPAAIYNILVVKDVKSSAPQNIHNSIRINSNGDWGVWDELYLRSGLDYSTLLQAGWTRFWSEKNHADQGDPHPQYELKRPGMILGGTTNSFTLNTSDSKLVNYSQSGEIYTSGNVNATAGEITIPSNGVYRVLVNVLGLQGNDTKEEWIELKLDVATVDPERYTIGFVDVTTDKTSTRQVLSIATRPFVQNQVLSVYMWASSGLGTFTVVGSSFEVEKVIDS